MRRRQPSAVMTFVWTIFSKGGEGAAFFVDLGFSCSEGGAAFFFLRKKIMAPILALANGHCQGGKMIVQIF